jgi:ABC-type multidrug transport system ATPase subunit
MQTQPKQVPPHNTTSPALSVEHGEVFGFLGPNGAGKTRTVRTLGTLIAPTSGSAIVAGIALTPENGAAHDGNKVLGRSA